MKSLALGKIGHKSEEYLVKSKKEENKYSWMLGRHPPFPKQNKAKEKSAEGFFGGLLHSEA